MRVAVPLRLLLGVLVLACAVPAAASAAFPGGEGRIAFEMDPPDGEAEIATLDPAGGGAFVYLTENTWLDEAPAWSPDGTKIAWVSRAHGNEDIYVMNADGSSPRRLTFNTGFDRDPTWSPDGTRIAFESQRASLVNVWSVGSSATDLTDIRQHTGGGGVNTDPAWSPDGSTIVFESTRDGNADIWAIDAGLPSPTTGATNLTQTSGTSNIDPKWAPDGATILFTRPGPQRIFSMNADGSAQTQRTDSGRISAQAAPSPAGTRFAFTSNFDGNGEIWVAPMGGGTPDQLTATASHNATAPDWQPVPAPPDPPDDGGDDGGADPPGGSDPGPGGSGPGPDPGGDPAEPGTEGGSPPAADPGCPSSAGFGNVVALSSCFAKRDSAYVSAARVRVNGLDIFPLLRSKIVVDPATQTVRSEGQVRVFAGETRLYEGSIRWEFDKDGVSFEIAKDGVLKALPLQGTAKISAAGRGAFRIAINPRIEEMFSTFFSALYTGTELANGPNQRLPKLPAVTADLAIRTENDSGLQLDSLDLAARELFLGPLEIRLLQLTYDLRRDEWIGRTSMLLPGPIPRLLVDAELIIRQGRFGGASASVDGVNTHIGYGVYVQRLRLSVQTDPFFFGGGIGVSLGPKIQVKPTDTPTEAFSIDGDLSYRFTNPGVLQVRGEAKMGSLANARASVEYLTTGRINLAYDGLVGLGPDLGITTKMTGFIDGTRAFLLEGTVRFSLLGWGVQGNGLVSNIGLAACGGFLTGDAKGSVWGRVGVGYRWGGDVTVMGDSCDVGPWRPVANPKAGARAAQAGTVASTDLPAGLPVATFAVTGAGAPPRIVLVAPDGTRTPMPASPERALQGKVLILQRPVDRTTYVAVAEPAAGRWSIELEPGSAPATGVRQAEGLPAPQVDAAVRGRGHRRTLSWRVRPLPGQSIRFVEQGPQTARQIVRTSTRSGRVRFAPGDGKAGRRSIVAIVEQGGLTRAELPVTRYAAPAPRKPKRPRRLKVRRGGGALSVAWSRVKGADRYRVRAVLSDGRRLSLVRRRPGLRLPRFGSQDTARITVRGMRGMRSGPAASKRVARPRAGRRSGRRS